MKLYSFLLKKNKVSLVKQLVQDQLSLGELINIIIDRGEEVHTHIVDQGWHEVNARSALDNLNANHEFIHELMATHNDWSKRAVKYNQLDWVNRDILIKGMLDIVDGCHPGRALDVGTGTGKIMKAVRGKYPQCECWGIDCSEEMLSRIEDKDNYILRNVNADNLSGINNDYYDLVTARMVFHHIENSEKVMSEIKRVLKPGGIFIVCEGNPPSVRAIDWYTQMFSYKEKRKTLTEIDLINMLYVKPPFFDYIEANRNYLLYGPRGSGKTMLLHLFRCSNNEKYKKIRGFYINFNHITRQIENSPIRNDEDKIIIYLNIVLLRSIVNEIYITINEYNNDDYEKDEFIHVFNNVLKTEFNRFKQTSSSRFWGEFVKAGTKQTKMCK